ncbi:hypothetical protein QBC34DRAFT_460231 [Podospora aff. communis PSN243]|uniref:Uncharacterized protein n=1 Tax=Podospora aff. communis PSN243 TaxID=3040156 RepID=A0AAV9H3L4_9PEZI|nr:hypothetical protein QBC34DRAFT_460231 [Podospora aff. communis PSN243]
MAAPNRNPTGESDELHSILQALLDPQFYDEHVSSQVLEATTLQSFVNELCEDHDDELPQQLKSKLVLFGGLRGVLKLPSALCSQILLDPQTPCENMSDVIAHYWERLNADDSTRPHAVSLFETKPAAVISTLITRGHFQHHLPPAVRDNVLSILRGLDDSLNLLKQPLSPDIEALRALPGPEKQAARRFFGSIQQLCQIVIQPTDLPVLVALGFSSVEHVAYSPLATFRAMLAPQGIDTGHASKIHGEAKKVQRTAEQTHLALMFQDPSQDLRKGEPALLFGSSSSLTAKSGNKDGISPSSPSLGGNNMSTWFGDLDDMGCPDCCSVTSPAAYFVDLLRFLKNIPAGSALVPTGVSLKNAPPPPQSLLAKLFLRRPELGDLLLSCRNTSERVPYIDLVNEILESAIIYLEDKDNIGSGLALKSYNADSEEPLDHDLAPSSPGAAAKKQVPRDTANVNYALYDQVISEAVFPSSVFPYDQSVDALRSYLASSGVNPSEVLQCFETSSSPEDARGAHKKETLSRSRAASILNLTEGDFLALTEESFCSLDAARLDKGRPELSREDYQTEAGLHPSCYYWGYSSDEEGAMTMIQAEEELEPGVEHEGLTFIKEQLLPRLGESFATVVKLLKTRFMAKQLVVQPWKSSSSSNQQQVSQQLGDFRLRDRDGGPLDVFSLQRLEQLVRLWRRLRQETTAGLKENDQAVSWNLEDVDDALCMFGEPSPPPKGPLAITPATIKKIANIAQIARMSRVDPGRVLALFSKSATYLQQLPITRAVQSKSAREQDQASAPSRYLALLLASLDLAYSEFAQIEADEQLFLESPITDDTVFLFYRLSGLAKLFGVPYAQMTPLLAVLGEKDGAPILSSPEGLLRLLKKWQGFAAEGWSADALCATADQKAPDAQADVEKAATFVAKCLPVASKRVPLVDQAIVTAVQSVEPSLTLEMMDIFLNTPASTAPGGSVRDLVKSVATLASSRTATNQGDDVDNTILFFTQDTVLSIQATVSPGSEAPKSLALGFERSCPMTTASPAASATTTPIRVSGSVTISTTDPLPMVSISWPGELRDITLSFGAPTSKAAGQPRASPPLPPYTIARTGIAQISTALKQLRVYATLVKQYKIGTPELQVLAPLLLRPTSRHTGLIDDIHSYALIRKTLAGPGKENEVARLVYWFCTTTRNPLASVKETSLRFSRSSLLSQPLAEQLLVGNAQAQQPLARADRLAFLGKMADQARILSTAGLKQDSVPLLFSMATPLGFGKKSAATGTRPETALVHHLRAALVAREAYQALSTAQDRLRNNRRRALVQYLLQHPAMRSWGVQDEGGLFEFFLIDVQMSSALETTRIQQAISTVQLFVHRCLLGREKDVDARSISQDRWSWMQRLSTWEANRRVFLYPESYIDPTLRDNKTEIFKSVVEEAAMQNSLDDQVLRRILRGYVYGVHDVANLRVEAVYYDIERIGDTGIESPQGEGVYHFFARSRNAPYAYFYRSMEHTKKGNAMPSSVWTAWMKVPIEMASHDADADGVALERPGTYVVPVVWQKRLMVFMPKIALQTKVDKTANAGGKVTTTTSADNKSSTGTVNVGNPASVSVDIRLAWTELVDFVFVAPKQSGATLNVPADASGKAPAFDSFRFQALPSNDTISVLVYQNVSGTNKCLGQFVLQGATVAFTAAKFMGYTPRLQDANFPPTQFGSLTLSAVAPPKPGERTVAKPAGSPVDSGNWPKLPLPELGNGVAPASSMTWTLNSKYGSETGIVADVTSAASRGREPWFLLPSTTASVPLYNTLAESLRQALASDDGVEQIYRVMDKAALSNMAHSHAFGNSVTLAQCREDATPHAIYNWEAGFHVVALIVERLISLQQFDRALEYARLVFDATGSNQEAPHAGTNVESWRPTWRFPPFRDTATRTHGTAESVLKALGPSSGADATMESRILAWRRSPFRPHVVARNRPLAYMKRFVIKYIEALVAAGDLLFRQNSLELVPLAVQKYVEALHVFGPSPETATQLQNSRKFKSYNQLAHITDDFSNASVASRLSFPYFVPLGQRGANAGNDDDDDDDDLQGFPRTRYFGIQANRDFVKLRGLIEDRLFKIRNSLDINGNPRKLSLWDPPINPMDLVKAVAATGGNVRAALQGDTGLLAPSVNGRVLPRKRFAVLLSKAFELCAELKASSANLLAAIEKKDGEALSVLRAKADSALQRITIEMKTHQKTEAELGLGQLEQQRRLAMHRINHYAALTGDARTDLVPKANEDFQEIEQAIPAPMDKDLRLTRHETLELTLADSSSYLNHLAADRDLASSLYFMLPMPVLNFQFMGLGGSQALPNLGQVDQTLAAALRARSLQASENSARASRIAQWTRQLQERRLQLNLAGIELKSIDKQVEAQKARIASLEADLRAQQHSADSAAQTLDFYTSKFTTEQLYSWMEAGIRTTLYQTYLAAMELARKVESVHVFERGPEPTGAVGSGGARSGPFIAPAGYWDNSRHGLQAGDQLWLALKQLELAYLAKDDGVMSAANVVKNVSLRQLDPAALLTLRELGDASFKLPETVFDLDFPGHYFRRIKSVAFSIHCIAGPYTSISCTATLVDHKYRCSPSLIGSGANGYADKTTAAGTDDRFVGQDIQVPITSVAISSGQQDAGVFDLNFSGEDYQPFEGAGAISTWRLRLPDTVAQFDYRSISDVVLHMRYTARDGGDALRQAASAAAKSSIGSAAAANTLLLDMRQDAPDSWFSLGVPTTTGSQRIVTMRSVAERMPFYAKAAKGIKITGVTLYAAGPAEAQLKKMTFAMFGQRDHVPQDEVRLKWAEKFGGGNLHKFTVGAAQLAEAGGNGAPPAVGSLDVMKGATWYMSVDGEATAAGVGDAKASLSDVMMLVSYALVA